MIRGGLDGNGRLVAVEATNLISSYYSNNNLRAWVGVGQDGSSADGTYAYLVKDSTFNFVIGNDADSGAAKLQVTGGIQYVDGARPGCDAAHRGSTWYVAGGAGVKDTFALCGKNAADVYAWQSIY